MSHPAHRIVLVAALAVLVGGCSVFRRDPPAPSPPDLLALGAANTMTFTPPPEAAALGHYLAGVLAMNRGDQATATEEFEAALEIDPQATALRQRLAALYVRQGRLADALEQCQAAVAAAPNDVDSRLMLADVLSTLGRDRDAIAAYEAVLQLDPDREQARLLLGVLYAKQRDMARAEATLRYLIERDPGSFLGHYYLGRVYLAAQDFPKAEEAFTEALRLNPTAEPVLVDLAVLHEAAGRPEQAIAIYEQVLRTNPGRDPIRRRLGALYARQRKYDDALAQFRELERLDGDDSQDTRTKIGLILLETGEYDRAATEFSLVLAAEPDNARARYYLASAYEQGGQVERAIAEYEQVPTDHEWFVDAQRMIVHLHQQRGDHAAAAAAVERARARKPDADELIDVQAVVLREQGRLPEAIALMEDLVARHPDNDRYHFTLGALYDENKERERGMEEMRRAIELNPHNAPALNYLGYTYAEQGINLEEAESLIRRALAISPNDGFYIDSLGWVFYQRGDYEAAVQYLERATALAGDDATIAEHLGDAYQKAGRVQDALRTYRDALSRADDAAQSDRLRTKIDELQQRTRRGAY